MSGRGGFEVGDGDGVVVFGIGGVEGIEGIGEPAELKMRGGIGGR